jgi:hypothetical protein
VGVREQDPTRWGDTAPPQLLVSQSTPNLRHTLRGGYDPALHVRRPEEEDRALHGIQEYGATTLSGPARIGKSWLLRHIEVQHCDGWRVLDLSLAPARSERVPEGLLYSLGDRLAAKARLSGGAMQDMWKRSGTAADKLTEMMRAQILPDPRKLLVVLDGADEVADPNEGKELFNLVRAWVTRAQTTRREPWNRLHVALVMRGSPGYHANLGTTVEVDDFNEEQIAAYLTRVGPLVAAWSKRDVARLHELIAGQPILWALAATAGQSGQSLERILDTGAVPLEKGVFGYHLSWLIEKLLSEPSRPGPKARLMRHAAADVLSSIRIDDEEVAGLERLGLLVRKGREVAFRCKIYRQVAEQVALGR